MVFDRFGMGLPMTHNHPNDVPSTFMPLVNLDVRDMFLFPFIPFCLNNFWKIHFPEFELPAMKYGFYQDSSH